MLSTDDKASEASPTLTKPPLRSPPPASLPRLGDFSLLVQRSPVSPSALHSDKTNAPVTSQLNRGVPGDNRPRLGDFKDLFKSLRLTIEHDNHDSPHTLGQPEEALAARTSDTTATSEPKAHITQVPVVLFSETDPTATDTAPHQESDSDGEVSTASTVLTSPEIGPGDEVSWKYFHGTKPQPIPVLSYRLGKKGHNHDIFEDVLPETPHINGVSYFEVQESLSDKELQHFYPDIAANGIHVFLDLSNIQISFSETIKIKYGLDKDVRLVPPPKMDLSRLTNILIRGRQVRASWAACSTHPDVARPPWVNELKRLGYEVLLRERKRTGQGRNIHYVEDCVDESLHLRIAESQMESPNDQGTMVIVTGDAKPAPFSLGFLKYADWALRAGWNVEVVSWSTSLSSSWRNPTWRAKWGPRFRIIDLDPFLRELWNDQV